MSKELEKSHLFTRRALLVGGIQCGLLSVLAGRLYYLQVLQKDRLSTQAEDNRINVRLIAPSRGQILDRNNETLAINQQNYRLVLAAEQVQDLDNLLEKVNAVLPLSENDLNRIKRDFKKRGRETTVLVRDNLTWEQVSTISLHMPELSGVDIEVGELRFYPFSYVTSHLVGYVGAISQEDRDKNRINFSIPGFRIGKKGIEFQYDTPLRGQPGNLQLEVNARGRVVRELARNEPLSGQDVKLTLDIGLQHALHRRLEHEKSAAAVVMDCHTGAIYALVSRPSFDPNLFTYGISQKDWDGLNADTDFPLLNKVVDGVYAPGSTFKIVTALAALEADMIDPREQIFCPGHYELGDHRFHCWKRGGHGGVDFVNGMAWSCDTYYYEIGKRLGVDRIHTMAKRLGLGQATGIDFPHERTGLVPNRAWKRSTRNEGWQQGETLITAIGQGFLLASPLQLAVMTARIANGGYAVKPHLVAPAQGQWRQAKPNGQPLHFKKKNLDLLMKSLSAVVNAPTGTAYGSRIDEEGMEMGGKTGTSQVRRISRAERLEGIISNEMMPWRERDHALFVGYAPVHKPRYVAAVVIEHGGSGSARAAPVVQEILHLCQKTAPSKS